MVNNQGIDHFPYIGFRYDLFDIQRQTTLWVRWCPGLHQHLPAFGVWTDGFERYLSRGQQLIIGITIKAVDEFIVQRL